MAYVAAPAVITVVAALLWLGAALQRWVTSAVDIAAPAAEVRAGVVPLAESGPPNPGDVAGSGGI